MGDTLTLTGDTTLYAVWEMHSMELADAAYAEGKAPIYPRPDAIENSAALLLGTLTDLTVLTGQDTEIKTVSDEELGKVLSLTSTAASEDPYVTLAYGDLMKSLRLAPVTRENAAYLVMKVKNISLNNTAVDLYFNGSEEKVTATLSEGNEWQYLVINLGNADLQGELSTLRIDWERAANEAGNTMYIADIFFAANKDQANALADGHYIYPVQEQLEPETEPPTEDTDTAEDVTDNSSDEATDGGDDVTDGCTSTLGFSAALLLAVTVGIGAVALTKKKED